MATLAWRFSFCLISWREGVKRNGGDTHRVSAEPVKTSIGPSRADGPGELL
jgi:hypothetical protein